MIKVSNPLGSVCYSGSLFAELVSTVAQTCYGVAAMAPCGPVDAAGSLLPDNVAPEKGVRVARKAQGLCIELHIKVTYGVNIAAIVRSIIHKVKYAVEETTGLSVAEISVSVDDIVNV